MICQVGRFSIGGFEKNLGHGVKIGKISELGGFSWTQWYGPPIWRVGNRFCRILAGQGKFGCDYLINIPVLKALDGYAGISMAMKNHFGSIAGCSKLHHTIMRDIAKLNANPLIVKKTRLIIMDGIFAQYKWFNGRNQENVEKTDTILMGYDPVALDFIGWKIIEELRKAHGLQDVDPKPDYLRIASEKHGLGNCEKNKIDLADV